MNIILKLHNDIELNGSCTKKKRMLTHKGVLTILRVELQHLIQHPSGVI